MAKRQKAWAKRARAALVEALGGGCKRCGARDILELDCIIPQGPAHHRLDFARRTSFYRMQHKLGNLQALCPECHQIKTASDMSADYPTVVPLSETNYPY